MKGLYLVTHPPFNHMAHGTSERSSAAAVRDPFCVSNAQKKSVSLAWFSRFTATFPAKLRGTGKVTLGSESLTRKSKERKKIIQLDSEAIYLTTRTKEGRRQLFGREQSSTGYNIHSCIYINGLSTVENKAGTITPYYSQSCQSVPKSPVGLPG